MVSRLRSWWHELLSLRLDTSVHDPVASKEKQVVLEAQLSRGSKINANFSANFVVAEQYLFYTISLGFAVVLCDVEKGG